MATVQEVGQRLAAIERTLTILPTRPTTAFDDIPQALSSGQLPAFVNMPGRATRIPDGTGLLRLEREWTLELYLSEPTGSPETITLVYPIFQAVEEAFFARKGLELAADVLNGLVEARYEGDQGVGARPYPRNSTMFFLAVFFTVRVVTLRRVNLKLSG